MTENTALCGAGAQGNWSHCAYLQEAERGEIHSRGCFLFLFRPGSQPMECHCSHLGCVFSLNSSNLEYPS